MKSLPSLARRGRLFGDLPQGAAPISALLLAVLRWWMHRHAARASSGA